MGLYQTRPSVVSWPLVLRGWPPMPRVVAVNVLEAVESRGAFSNIALDAEIRRRRLSPRDAALATELVYGVLKNRVFLDQVLDHWLKKPVAKLRPFGRAALRVGAYQLVFLDRVPAHAAISETVELVKRRAGWMVGVTNAVLRRVSERRDALRAELDVPVSDAESFGRRFGLPAALAESLIERFGLGEAIEYARAVQEPPPVTLRVRRPSERGSILEALRATGVSAEPTGLSPAGIAVRGGGTRPPNLPPVLAGEAVVQDEGSQLAGFFAAPRAGWRVLDLCAGRGGKSFHLADQMGDQGRVLATDIHPGKLERLEAGARRLGIHSVEVSRAQAAGAFDLVLLDSPCTGSGSIRRHPELRWKITPERLHELSRTQRSLLKRAADLVRPGGLLVYVVCSELPQEGPRQVAWFLDSHPDFERTEPPEGLDWTPLLDPSGDLLLHPHRHDTDGFFAARLRRR